MWGGTPGTYTAGPVLVQDSNGVKVKWVTWVILTVILWYCPVGPSNPNIFNIITDVIYHNWLGLVAEDEAGMDGFGYAVSYKAAFLYADYGLVA